MPVIEVVLAAVGLSVGGGRAWRKLRGLPEEDGTCAPTFDDDPSSYAHSVPGAMISNAQARPQSN
jgi:hypothetical protein